MPRLAKRTRGRGRGRRNNSMLAPKISSVPFHSINESTLSGVTGNIVLSINPQSTPLGGLAEIADQFDLFRLSSFEYRIHPMDPTDVIMQTAAYVPDIDVQTVTTTQNSHNTLAVCQTPFSGVPSPWLKVPRSLLKGMIDWYKCTADAGAAEFESQGSLMLAGGLSDVIRYEVRGVCQFKNPVSSSVMIERTIARFERLGLVVRLPKKTCDVQERCVGKTPA